MGTPKHERKKRAEVIRDWTNSIKIGGEVFEIAAIKGKKIVRLPWEKLQRALSDAGDVLFKGLRGVIILKDDSHLLDGEKLDLILSIAPTLDIGGALGRTLPKQKQFDAAHEINRLVDALPLVLSPARWKKDKKEFGFICLTTNGQGRYRLRCTRGFHTALNESIASLETLIDELSDDVDLDKKNLVNTVYRRLSDYLN